MKLGRPAIPLRLDDHGNDGAWPVRLPDWDTGSGRRDLAGGRAAASRAAGRSPAAAALAMPLANGVTYALALSGRINEARNAALGLHHSAATADEWMFRHCDR